MLTSGVNDVIINTGVNGGMVKVSELTTKLNNLENDINDLKSIFSSWTPVPSDGGAALKLLLTPYYGQTLTPTAQSEIENTKVKH
jgi:hypothetical protein